MNKINIATHHRTFTTDKTFLVKCKNLMFSGFIDTLKYGFSSTGVTIYCYFGLNFNDNTCCEVICKRRYNDNDIMTTHKLHMEKQWIYTLRLESKIVMIKTTIHHAARS